MTIGHVVEAWAIRSALIAVADVDRCLTFYRDIGRFEEIARDDTVVVLGAIPPGSMFLILRKSLSTHGVRHGQQAVGLRSLAFNVRSVDELDRIETVLRDHGGFTRRWKGTEGTSELVTGRDPDNLPLAFGSYDKSQVLWKEYYQAIIGLLHSLDV
jgi:catechol-2,3-dioxygenase